MKKLLTAVLMLSVFSVYASHCASVFTGKHAEGKRLDLYSSEGHKFLDTLKIDHHNTWNNKISSVVVKKGCSVIAYQYLNYGVDFDTHRNIGFVKVLENNSESRDSKMFNIYNDEVDNRISSIKCFCL